MTFDDTYFLEEERDGFLISSMMKRAWAAQVEVLEEIRRVCNQLGISYFADFGTLLGTVRHQGFIPWDDDVDICMLRKDYNVFLERAPELLDSWYELKNVYNDPTFDIVKARLINGRHMNFNQEFLEKFHHCPYVVGVDIFPIDNVPDDACEYNDLVKSLDFLLRVEASIPETECYGEDILSLIARIEETYGVPIDYANRLQHEVKKVYDTLCGRYVNEETKDVGCMMGLGAGWTKFRYPKATFETSIYMPFENIILPVPAGYDLVLRACYGDDYILPQNTGSSHDYPFYKEQMEGLRQVMEQEFQTSLSDEQMERLIEARIGAE